MPSFYPCEKLILNLRLALARVILCPKSNLNFLIPNSFFLLSFIFLLSPFSLHSQSVGIFGSTNLGVNNTGAKGNVKAVFDISSSDKGILIPRITTASRDTFTNVPTSLLFFNTTTNQYEYYNGSTWSAVAATNTNWSLTGNAGTVDGTNFIGTTDDIPFNIRVFNQKAGRIESDNGANTGGNTFIGYQSGNSNYVDIDFTKGMYNTASGFRALFTNTTGTSNTANGYQALFSNATGSANTASGVYALRYSSTGGWNTATGHSALASNINGNNNTAFGYYSMYYNKAGSNATALGYGAMQYANDQAVAFTNYNVAVGYEALRGSITPANNFGNNNTSLGYQTLLSNTSGDYNSATGFSAMYWNTTGDYNTAYGASSLLQNSTGSNNTAVGYQALYGNTASNNTAVGTYALGGNTSGTNNTAMGYQSLFSNVTSHNNSAFGTNALVNNTYGSQNTALGSFALYTQSYNNFSSPWTTDNVAVGYQALYSNQPTSSTNGYLNTAIGAQAMLSNTIGSHNTAIGRQSLYLNASGSYNTASGYQALFNNAGFENTATGYFSLYSNTSGTGNVAVGFHAGYTANAANANTTGSYNVFIGNNSGPGVASASNLQNAIAIGKNALVDASNTFILGGTGADAVNVGIGTSLPMATLDITRDGGTVLFPRKSSVGDPAGAINGMIYYNANTNKFRAYENGVWADMATTGGSGWSLLGNGSTVDGTNFLGTTDGAPLNFRVNSQKAGRISSGDNLFLGYAAGNSSSINVIDNIAIGDSAMYTQSFGTAFSSHNVALGNSALFLNNPTAISTGDQNTAIGNRTLRNNTDGYSNTALGFDALYSNSSGDVNTGIGILSLNSNTTGNANTAVGGGALYSNLSGNGNVALGYQAGLTGTPANANTSGSFNTYIGYNAGPASATQRTKSAAIGYNALVDADNSLVLGGLGADAVNVGIGTTSPAVKLHLGGNSEIRIGDGTASTAQKLSFFTPGAGYLHLIEGGGDNNALVVRSTKQSGLDALMFDTYNAAASGYLNRFTITGGATTAYAYFSNSNVGIGTTTVNQKLELKDGNILLSNSATAGELRFAEPLASGANYSAFKAQAQAADITYSLPTAISAGNFLSTDGSGNLSWAPVSGTLSGGTIDYIPKWTSATSLGNSAINDNGTRVHISSFLSVGAGSPPTNQKIYAEVGGASADHGVRSVNFGTGNAGIFEVNNAASAADAMNITTNSSNSKGLNISHTGTGGVGANYGIYSTALGVRGAGSTNTAGYFSASGATNNYAVIVPSGGGNVGIGTTTPTTLLDVYSSGAIGLIRGYSNGTGKVGDFQINNSGNASDAVSITTDGTGKSLNVSQTNITNGGTHYSIYSTASTAAGITGIAGYFSSTGAGTNYSAIFDQGNVGIGTTAPAGTLEVQGGTNGSGAGIPISLKAQNAAAGGFAGGNILLTPGTGTGAGNNGRLVVGTNPIANYAMTLDQATMTLGNNNGLAILMGAPGASTSFGLNVIHNNANAGAFNKTSVRGFVDDATAAIKKGVEGWAQGSGVKVGGYFSTSGVGTNTGIYAAANSNTNDNAADINGTILLTQQTFTPTQTSVVGETKVYVKNTGGVVYYVIQYNDAGTMKYRYLTLTSINATWTYSTTAP